MKIVYVILAHKLPDQVLRLVTKLNTSNNFFLVHVDKKTDAKTYGRMRTSLTQYPNVRFLRRYVCWWGDSGVLDASLEGIREIVNSRIPCDYLILLSGQDYPIKSNDQIRDTLQQCRGQSFMEYFALPDEHWRDENGGLNRIAYWHFNWRGHRVALRRNGRVLTLISALLGSSLAATLPVDRRIPGNLQPFGGSALWCISRECVELVYTFVKHNQAFLKFFKNVLSPEEIFYQTVLLNSRLKSSIVNDDLHHIVWRSASSLHPTILAKRDLADIMTSGKLFARKFDVTVDETILDLIDSRTS